MRNLKKRIERIRLPRLVVGVAHNRRISKRGLKEDFSHLLRHQEHYPCGGISKRGLKAGDWAGSPPMGTISSWISKRGLKVSKSACAWLDKQKHAGESQKEDWKVTSRLGRSVLALSPAESQKEDWKCTAEWRLSWRRCRSRWISKRGLKEDPQATPLCRRAASLVNLKKRIESSAFRAPFSFGPARSESQKEDWKSGENCVTTTTTQPQGESQKEDWKEVYSAAYTYIALERWISKRGLKDHRGVPSSHPSNLH